MLEIVMDKMFSRDKYGQRIGIFNWTMSNVWPLYQPLPFNPVFFFDMINCKIF